MQEKVFIYDSHGVGPNSRDDLKKLFEEYPIYDSPMVACTDLTFNFDGLRPDKTTIVFPGGNVSKMGLSMEGQKIKIQDFFHEGCKGVFVCAGAYLASNSADIFLDEYKINSSNEFLPLRYIWNTTRYNLNIVSNYKAIGPFIPNSTYALKSASFSCKIKKPYCVTLALENNQSIQQMYLAGCGFQPIGENNGVKEVATYRDCSQYTFFRPAREPETISAMPAIIQMREKHILLSGPHIETCVEDSKLLKLMHDGDETTTPLPESAYDADSSREFVIPLLRDTLTCS